MIFANRTEAGRSLARRLEKYADREDVIVLGVPRGGVPVAFEVAQALHAPLDIFLLRKLGVPCHEESAFGAIASGGVRVLNRSLLEQLAISSDDVAKVTEREAAELKRRELAYRGSRPALKLMGKIVILVDDGIATGSSLLAAVGAIRQLNPAKIVIAVPVAPKTSCEHLAYVVDEVVCVASPESFHAVGQFYGNFSQVTDTGVIDLLTRSERALKLPVSA